MDRKGSTPARSRAFRLMTIAASGLGSFVLCLWALRAGFGSDIAGLPADVAGGMIAGLCALAASVATISFFAGVDESASYVYRETQIDKLTGLLGRAAMIGKIAEAASATIRTGKPAFLLDIDIDRFKQINDSIGYDQGDQLVRAFAERMKEVLPPGVEMGRIAAGKFAVLIPDMVQLGPVDELVEDMIGKLMQPYQLPSHLQSVNMAVGIVAMPKDGVDPIMLLRRSNLALQHAKAGGMGNWAVFHEQMGRVAEYRQWIESELHGAFQRGDFELHYQPQLDLASGRTVGYEALVRWRHPERGMIPPGEFVPVAEETGMIGPIGDWVLHKACLDARIIPDNCFVAVNISPLLLANLELPERLEALAGELGVPPARIILEVTESWVMEDSLATLDTLTRLRLRGFQLSIDDFGTGYSTMAQLHEIPYGEMKLDQRFVRNAARDREARAIVESSIQLGHKLGMRVVAEGVERQEDWDLITELGCDEGQGYFLARPMEPGALRGWLARWNATLGPRRARAVGA